MLRRICLPLRHHGFGILSLTARAAAAYFTTAHQILKDTKDPWTDGPLHQKLKIKEMKKAMDLIHNQTTQSLHRDLNGRMRQAYEASKAWGTRYDQAVKRNRRETVLNDDPELTVREFKGKQPLRIVIDPELKLDLNKKIFNDNNNTIIVNNKVNKVSNNLTYLKLKSENIILNLLNYLHEINIMSLIVEGGKETIDCFLKLNYWNEARVIEGNKKFNNGLESPKIERKCSAIQNIGKDIIYTYYND